MSSIAIKVENVSKQYRLGEVGTGTMTHDLNRWWHKIRGKEDPYLQIGEANDRTQKAESEYVWALKNIDFEIQKGEMIGIVGRNGAGKSTLLKILSRITQPTTGTMKVNGRIASLLEVGTGFHPELTGRENIFLNGSILGMKKHEIASKFDEIVEFAGVERYIDTPVKRYSSGMYVRLAFGVAAHLQPEILIIDEVLAVGDSEFQRKSIAKMEQVCKDEGKTLIFVSHNSAAIQRLCQKCVYLKEGQMVLFDETDKIIQHYNKDSYESDLIKKGKFVGDSNNKSFGNFKVKISEFAFYNATTGEETYIFKSGESVEIKLRYASNSYENDKIGMMGLGLQIFNANGQFVTVLNNAMAYKVFRESPLNGIITCILPKLPLMFGEFYIRPNLMVDGEVAEQYMEGVKITVEENDFYGTGISNAYGRQGVYIEQNWMDIEV